MKAVMIFGTFDIVHHGHLNFFQQAKKFGDYLIVVVARDVRVKKLKAPPVYNEKERKKFLEQIRMVDSVVLGDKNDVYKVIKKLRPNSIVLGYDQLHYTDKLQAKLEEFGLKTKVVRAKPFNEKKFKTGIIKKVIESSI